MSAFFTIYGFELLEDVLAGVDTTRFLFGDPTSVDRLDPTEKEPRFFKVTEKGLLPGVVLRQKHLAQRCAGWIEDGSVGVRAVSRSGFLHGKMYLADSRNGQGAAVVGSSNFTKRGLGGGEFPNLEINLATADRLMRKELGGWFDELWNDTDLTRDAKEQVLAAFTTIPARHLDIANYPAVECHLLSFGKTRLKQIGKPSRKKTSHAWFELQDATAFYREFEKEKVFWTDLTDDGRFHYDSSGIYGEATTFIITGKSLKYLCAVLNSKLATWFLQHSAPTSGTGTFRWKKAYVETIPVPEIPTLAQRPLVELVDSILASKKSDEATDTRTQEAEIDRMVYDLYGLTSEEIQAVEARLPVQL